MRDSPNHRSEWLMGGAGGAVKLSSQVTERMREKTGRLRASGFYPGLAPQPSFPLFPDAPSTPLQGFSPKPGGRHHLRTEGAPVHGAALPPPPTPRARCAPWCPRLPRPGVLTQVRPVLQPHLGHPALAAEVMVRHVRGPERGLGRGERSPELQHRQRLLGGKQRA